MSWGNNKIILSAVIPVGNIQKDLINLTNLISTTDFSRVELILVIDSKEMVAQEIIEKIQGRFNSKNLIFIFGPGCGPGPARNSGLKIATGPWITFWDSDDVPNHQNILSTLEEVGNKEYEIVIGGYRVQNLPSGTIQEYPISPESVSHAFYQVAMNPGIWRMCFRSNTICNIKFPEIYMGEDQVFVAEYFCKDRKIFYADEIFYTYCKGVIGQLTNNKKRKRDIARAVEQLVTLISKSNNPEFIKLQIVRLIISGILRGNWKTRILITGLLTRSILVKKDISPSQFAKMALDIRENHYAP